MDTLTAIYNRRTVHSWADTTLEDDTLQILLEAAHQAPCHKMTWPWRFIVVGQQTRERIIPIGTTLAAAKAGIAPSPKVERAVRGKICHPAALVAVVLSRSDDAFRAREDYAATACAIQNMMLAAAAAGLGSKWGTGKLTRHPEVWSILGVDTAIEEVVGFISIGVPAKVPEIIRPPVADHIVQLP